MAWKYRRIINHRDRFCVSLYGGSVIALILFLFWNNWPLFQYETYNRGIKSPRSRGTLLLAILVLKYKSNDMHTFFLHIDIDCFLWITLYKRNSIMMMFCLDFCDWEQTMKFPRKKFNIILVSRFDQLT